MKGLCNFVDERSGDLTPVENIEEINLINSKFKGKLCQAYSLPPTLFLYNFSYGKVITHGDKYNKNFVFVKSEKQKFVMKVGERIRAVREALGLTQKEFAGRIGITYQMLGLYERGKYEPSEKVLKLISSTFGVSYEWLREGKGEMWWRKDKALLEGVGARLREFAERLVRIPVVGDAGAGFPKSPADIEVVGYILVSKETLQKGGRFAVQVRGDSMEPTLHNGDFVVFKPYVGDGSDIPSGKIVVVRNIGGELIVKRLVRINGLTMLTSDNPKYPPIPPERAQEEELRIVGVAIKIVREIEV
jgi:phage repressor protein C with HTH and peptisase S24 domain